MPHKFNAAGRHKFDKAQYRVINWAEYNESLRQRGDLTIWVSEEAQSVWSAPRRTSRGGQRRYSDLAIETCLTLRTAYRLGLRQTQGLMGSIGTLMGLDIRVPDFSTLSRRANGLSIAQVMRQAGSVPVHLVVDSTGLKIFGEGEWLAQKHRIKGIRRRWRKLHLGLDLNSGAIVCANLTHDDVGDSTALPGLLDQLDAPVTGFLADGAYDGASTRDLLRHRYGETLDVVIPPPKNAVIRPQSARDPTVRDRHIAQIRSNGRMAWQVATGYNQRSRIETQIGRWKSVIGPKLKSRSFSRQITEIQVGQKVLNTMTALGTSRVRTHRLTLPLGKGGIPSPPRSMQQRYRRFHRAEDSGLRRMERAQAQGIKETPGLAEVHIGVDAEGFIVAAELTASSRDDASTLPALLDTIEVPIRRFTADGAYDHRSVYDQLSAAGTENVVIVIPPRRSAVSAGPTDGPWAQRDTALERIRQVGRREWQKESGYRQQARVENSFFRYKSVLGGGLKARHGKAQRREVAIECHILNRMAELGRPKSCAVVS